MMEDNVKRWEIAKQAYAKIVKAITDLESEENIYCDLPEFIDVDGQRFFKYQLHWYCKIPEYTPSFEEISKQLRINADIIMRGISNHVDKEIERLKKAKDGRL
jgi:hypothetical protein